ncbi:MAG TPA: neutral/alkaline non-lysosomal ceramidase N-terminal domain-containing protein [Bryobacteraceae bacterium]|nr:neutral/alkaline non-lysosomal ceramidase N-terminal domain-containing protein [Bryobacteraceae bacterium]
MKAGFGKRPISPAVGAPLAGFAARKGNCQGVHDELLARALVIESGSTAVALVSLDVIAVASDFVEKVRRTIASRLPIALAAILISSTHTHAGPVTVSTFFNPDESLDASYMSRFEDAIVRAVEDAWQSRFAARIGIGSGTVEGLGVNRRTIDRKPVDREAGIVKVEDEFGKVKAILVNYGCHPTVLGPDNLLASGDFPAAAIERLEAQLGPGSFAMYVNGAQGDISVGHSSELSAIGVVTPNRTFERATELGHNLGNVVLEALPTIATKRSVPLRFETLTAGLPIKPYPDPSQTARELRQAEERADMLAANGNSTERMRAQSELLYASITHYYARETRKYTDGVLPIELQAIQIDDSVFVAVPAEVFVEIGMRIKSASPLRTFVAGVTNGYIGYLPSRKAYKTGGYEVVSAKCDDSGEDRLFEGVMRLEQRLAEQHA